MKIAKRLLSMGFILIRLPFALIYLVGYSSGKIIDYISIFEDNVAQNRKKFDEVDEVDEVKATYYALYRSDKPKIPYCLYAVDTDAKQVEELVNWAFQKKGIDINTYSKKISVKIMESGSPEEETK